MIFGLVRHLVFGEGREELAKLSRLLSSKQSAFENTFTRSSTVEGKLARTRSGLYCIHVDAHAQDRLLTTII